MPLDMPEEHRMLQDLVAKFVDDEMMPLEPKVIEREIKGEKLRLLPEEEKPLLDKSKELGLWALDSPEEFGGANLPAAALMGVHEELARTITPFYFPPDSPNLHMLGAVATPMQRKKYMEPYARGEAHSAIAISEPGAGGDPSGMTTKAEKVGKEWVINGGKIWVSRVPYADFTVVMARVGEEKGRKGITAFIVDKGTPGFEIAREIPMLAGHRTYEIVFNNCRIPEENILGKVGEGFAPMQLRLNVRRLQMGATSIGLSRRAMDMLCTHAKQRKTFGGSAFRSPGRAMVDRRRRHQDPRLPADGARCRRAPRQGRGRAPARLDDQGVLDGDGNRDHRQRHAGLRRHGRDQGDAACS